MKLSPLDPKTPFRLFRGRVFMGMRLNIFLRMMIGYLAIYLLVMSVSVYAIFKLRQFNQVTGYILDVDNSILDYEEKLIDSMLSQLRYERKYIITKDGALYDEFFAAKNEFTRHLAEVRQIADTSQKKRSLDRVKAYHELYLSLVDEEVAFVRRSLPYSQKWYEDQKERASDKVLTELEMLEVYSRQDIYNQMKMLGEAGASARRVAIVMAVVAIVLVIGTSFFITRSITRPLNLLMDKIREVSGGVFRGDVNIPSPPEISELSTAFNTMCGKLNALDKMKSEFFSTMSHELRTPLTSIREGSSLLLEGVGGAVTEKQKRLLAILSEESRRLIDLVNSLLDLSKMEAGMMTYTFEKADLTPLIHQTEREIVPLVESKKINLATEIAEGLPIITMDVERILQVLRNLVGNAVKFTPEGGRVRILARSVPRGVEVSVADIGPGIPPENLTAIFEKFQQASISGSYRAKGTGLGLAIAKHIITSHGGKIWAESKPGQGSTFIFVLPS